MKRELSPLTVDHQRIHAVFKFLKGHAEFNRRLQNANFKSWFSCRPDVDDKISALFFHSANSQPNPDIDALSKQLEMMFRQRAVAKRVQTIPQLKKFFQSVGRGIENTEFETASASDCLFDTLRRFSGWGPKVSALFVKSLYRILTDPRNSEIRFISVNDISDFGGIRLPVDRVILHIFEKHLIKSGKANFDSINETLRNLYRRDSDMALWDDLWFWGFVTQRTENKERRTTLNMEKYWLLDNGPKESASTVKRHASTFIDLLK